MTVARLEAVSYTEAGRATAKSVGQSVRELAWRAHSARNRLKALVLREGVLRLRW